MVTRGTHTVELKTTVGQFARDPDAAIRALSGAIVEAMGEWAETEILGYVVCEGCHQPTSEEIARVTGGICGLCFREGARPRLKELEVLVDGARTKVSIDGPKRKRSGSRGSKETKRKVDLAKRRALRRLRWAHQLEYEEILAEERAKAGLEPLPLARVVRTVIDDDVYHSGHGSSDGDARGRSPA